MLCYAALSVMLLLCCIVLRYVVLCYVTLSCVMLCYVMLYLHYFIRQKDDTNKRVLNNWASYCSRLDSVKVAFLEH